MATLAGSKLPGQAKRVITIVELRKSIDRRTGRRHTSKSAFRSASSNGKRLLIPNPARPSSSATETQWFQRITNHQRNALRRRIAASQINARSGRYQTTSVTHINRELAVQWTQLWESADNASVFNSNEWFRTHLELGRVSEHELHLCYRDETLVAVLPLKNDRRFGIHVSGAVETRFTCSAAFLVEKYDEMLFRAFFGSIFAKENVYLPYLDGRAADLFHDIFPDVIFSFRSADPYVTLGENPYSTTSRSTLRQIRGILKKHRDRLSFKTYNSSDNLQQHFDTIFMIEQGSPKRKRSQDIFSDQHVRQLFRALGKNCSQFVRIDFLCYDDVPIAYQFGFLSGTVFSYYQAAFLCEYACLSPGRTILFYLLQSLKDGDIDTLDLSRHQQVQVELRT
jgi:hypothetical protein